MAKAASEQPEEHSVSTTASRYLEAIFYMTAEGDDVRASRLAEWLGVAQPTVGAMLHRMVTEKMVAISAAKSVSLTKDGYQLASRIVRRHRIAERWLTDVVGLDWLSADEEAAKLEHAFSDDVAERLHVLIGKPATCPHGNPIPPADGHPMPPLDERPLSSLEAGSRAVLRRVSEVAEHDTPELLRFLGDNQLFIGTEVETVNRSAGARTQTVRVGKREVSMSLEVAGKIWI